MAGIPKQKFFRKKYAWYFKNEKMLKIRIVARNLQVLLKIPKKVTFQKTNIHCRWPCKKFLL
jgi:hypothetical protein